MMFIASVLCLTNSLSTVFAVTPTQLEQTIVDLSNFRKKCQLSILSLFPGFNFFQCFERMQSKIKSLASERSERDTIRGVQIQAGAVYINIYIHLLHRRVK